MKPTVAVILVCMMLAGCAIHEGAYNSNVALTNNQFRVAGTAVGHASATYIFGIGGLGKDALVAEAKNDLYSRYPFSKGMVLANVSVDFKRSFYFVAATNMVTISADVIDFNPGNFDLPYKGFYTDDSTFFPMPLHPVAYTAKSYLMDNELNYIKTGSKITFKINNTAMKGTVEEINNYGIKCSYQTESGMKKIYLQANNITVTE